MDSLGFVAKLEGGRLIETLAENAARVAAEVLTTHNKGTVTLTIDISQPNQDEPAVIVSGVFKTSLPKSKARPSYWYLDEEGAFHRDDPRQTTLPFRVVDTETGEIRKAADEPDVRKAAE